MNKPSDGHTNLVYRWQVARMHTHEVRHRSMNEVDHLCEHIRGVDCYLVR